MAAGQTGMTGISVVCRAEEEFKEEIVAVMIRSHSMEESFVTVTKLNICSVMTNTVLVNEIDFSLHYFLALLKKKHLINLSLIFNDTTNKGIRASASCSLLTIVVNQQIKPGNYSIFFYLKKNERLHLPHLLNLIT